jgi:hypothetical protein
MSVLDEVLSANDRYAASFGEKAELTLPPRARDPHLHGRPGSTRPSTPG